MPLLRGPVAVERTYSTTDVLAAEARALSLVAQQLNAGIAGVPATAAEAVLTRDAG